MSRLKLVEVPVAIEQAQAASALAVVLACALGSPTVALYDSAGKITFGESSDTEGAVRAESKATMTALALFDSWCNEDSDYDQTSWPLIARAIDDNRLSDRKLFET